MIKRLLITTVLSFSIVNAFGVKNPAVKSEIIPSPANKTQYYKGFFDLGYTFGSGDLAMDRLELSTTHGVQLNPHVFTGAGIGFNYFFDEEGFNIPIFANVRGTCSIEKLRNIVPFLDFKLGYSLADIKGLYLSPSVGATFLLKGKYAINTSLGFVVQQCKYEDEFESGSEYYNGFCLRFGFEF